jgi:hypothetical protein
LNTKLGSVTLPGQPEATGSDAVRVLTIVAGALTTASMIVNVILQIVRFMGKRPTQPGQRDRVDTAALALGLLRQTPLVVRQIRLLASQLKPAP